MDTVSAIFVTGFTVLVVSLCIGGIYANTHRHKRDKSQ